MYIKMLVILHHESLGEKVIHKNLMGTISKSFKKI